MRCLVLPNYGKNIKGYAPYEMVKSFMRTVIEEDPLAWFEFVLPSVDKNWKAEVIAAAEEDIKKVCGDRIRIHHTPMIRSALNETAMLTRELYELFNVQRSPILYDCVFVCRPMFTPALKRALKSKYEIGHVSVPVFSYNGRATTAGDDERESKYNFFGDDTFGLVHDEALAEAAGSICDFSMWLTETEHKLALDNVRKFLSTPMVKGFIERSIVCCVGGLETTRLSPLFAERRAIGEARHEKITAAFGGRWDGQKGFTTILRFFDRAVQLGIPCGQMMTTAEDIGDGELTKLRKAHPQIEFKTKTDKDAFFRLMQNWDVSLCFSTVEGSGLSYQEMLYSGVALVMKECAFAHEVTPPGYPLIGKDEDEMLLLFLKALREPAIVTEWMPKVRAWLEKRFEATKEHMKGWDWMRKNTEAVFKRQYHTFGGSVGKLANEALETFGGSPASYQAVTAQMQKLSTAGREFGRKGDLMYHKTVIDRLIKSQGYVDLCRGDEPEYVKAGTESRFASKVVEGVQV